MNQKWAKNNIFYWISSLMKIYIICCVPAQIAYLGKFLFLRYRSKCSQPIRLQDFLINHISKTNPWNSLIFYVDTNSYELNVDQKFVIKWVWSIWSRDSKIDCISRMNWWNELIFFILVEILKVISIIFGWVWLKIVMVCDTLKPAVS